MSLIPTDSVFFSPLHNQAQLKAQKRRLKFVGHRRSSVRDGYSNAINRHVSVINPNATAMTKRDEHKYKSRFNPGQVKLNQSTNTNIKDFY